MKDTIQKSNSILLGLFVTCGLGLTAANGRKALADSSGGSSSDGGCQEYIGSLYCESGRYPGEPGDKRYIGTACGTVNTYDCCLYDHYSVPCLTPSSASNGSSSYTITTHSYLVLIGANTFKDCQSNSCVAFPSSGGSSSGGSSSGGSSSGGSSYAGRSSYYFQV